MNKSILRRVAGRLACAALFALPGMVGADGPVFTEWSEPVHLGDVVNSASQEISPALSPDGLSLYFSSDRPDGGFGGQNIWVSQRDCESCPWESPVPLGPNINAEGHDVSPAFSPSGHLLFFASERTGPGRVFGGSDIWVSFRKNRHDDFGWGRPFNLGPFVNTSDHEFDPAFLPGRFWLGGHTFYFTRSTAAEQDIFEVDASPLGIPSGPAVPITEINVVGGLDGGANLRRDGLEVVFWSVRTGSVGPANNADVWSATRPHIRAPWSPPVNLGEPVNTRFAEISVGMTSDGTQLFIAKGQQLGGLGLRDLWMATRERFAD